MFGLFKRNGANVFSMYAYIRVFNAGTQGHIYRYYTHMSGAAPKLSASSFVLTVTVTVTVTDNLFKHELQKSPALPPSCPDYYADLFYPSSPHVCVCACIHRYMYIHVRVCVYIYTI
jgi:hypothetical protein